MRPILTLVLIVTSFSHPVFAAEDDSGANQIFVQALQQYRAVPKDASAPKRLEALDNLVKAFDKILAKYPNSQLAVQFVTGQRIGDVDATALRDEHENLFVKMCMNTASKRCLKFLKHIIAERNNLAVALSESRIALNERSKELAERGKELGAERERSANLSSQTRKQVDALNLQLVALRRQLTGW